MSVRRLKALIAQGLFYATFTDILFFYLSAQQYPVAEMGDRLATIDMGRKLRAVPL